MTVALPAPVLEDDDATVERWLDLLSAGLVQSGNGRRGQVAAECEWLFDDDTRMERWPHLTRPSLVVAFEHDLCFPPRRGREAAGSMPRGSFVEIGGVGHGNGAFDAAGALGDVVLDFWAAT